MVTATIAYKQMIPSPKHRVHSNALIVLYSNTLSITAAIIMLHDMVHLQSAQMSSTVLSQCLHVTKQYPEGAIQVPAPKSAQPCRAW